MERLRWLGVGALCILTRECRNPESAKLSDARWPVSRVLSDLSIWTIIPLGALSPAPSSSQPAAFLPRRTVSRRLFDLAPTGVCHAIGVTADAVGSYPTISPLPHCCQWAVSFLWHFPSRVTSCPGVTWQSVHGARTFLEYLANSASVLAIARPTHT